MIDYDELTAEEKADIRAALTSFMIVEQTPISFSLPCEDGARCGGRRIEHLRLVY